MDNQTVMPFNQDDSFDKSQNIRKVWHTDEWYFSIVDVIEVLTESPIARTY